MKNVRAAKALGMRTVLVTGLQEDEASRATNMADQPDESDAAVDCAIAVARQIKAALPELWRAPAAVAPASGAGKPAPSAPRT